MKTARYWTKQLVVHADTDAVVRAVQADALEAAAKAAEHGAHTAIPCSHNDFRIARLIAADIRALIPKPEGER
jgi:hypothetical protein